MEIALRKDERANLQLEARGGEREKQVLRSSSLCSESHQDDILRRQRDSGSLPGGLCEAVQLGAMSGIPIGFGERV